ncbi:MULTISPECIES: hypothetical protein [Actinoalloteichus]|uniref:Uncharacterized protein n=1 Tax=Actinoalloteichus fjordicus TaxID=1612552 RepID=A0AAC9LIV1_9PSEU|nr:MULTISPECIES: hypothetical protein [Actinoalloteichus]APU17140.1 hypothetical protein UA74_25665 [Actinoalloteichus fjordicus]APU23222.1 hypothetical protein UA75_26245 [Actinoalloteichus sp. GBA129-24]
MATVELFILTGWNEGPFYYDNGDPGESLNHWIDEESIAFLQLDDDLVRDITAWDEEYQDLYDPDDPQGSGFPTSQAKTAWIERGKELAARIKRESPVVASVDYQGNGSIPEGTCVF